MNSPGFVVLSGIPYNRMTRRGNNNNSSQNGRRRRRQKQNIPRTIKISDCAAKYAYALHNPFRAFAEGVGEVCVPDQSLIPSVKSRFKTIFNGSTGVNSWGSAAAMCGGFGSSTTVAISSNSVNTGTAATTFGAMAGNFANFTTCEWPASEITGSARLMRIVAYGIRIRYTGTQLNMGGVVHCYRSPNNRDLGLTAIGDLGGYAETVSLPFDREWKAIHWTPQLASDFAYNNTVSLGEDTLVFAIQSAAAQQPFEIEVVAYTETVGVQVGGTTPTHSDAVGFSAAQQASQGDKYVTNGSGPSKQSVLEKVGHAIGSASHYIASHSGEIESVAKGGAKLLTYLGV